MNIFVIDPDVTICARALDDKRLVKMILETAQLLCTAADHHGHPVVPYRPTHHRHPCALWARATRGNFVWLQRLGHAYGQEYTYRFNRVHKSQLVIDSLCPLVVPPGARQQFVDCTPYAGTPGTVFQHYMQTLMDKWESGASWTRTPAPPIRGVTQVVGSTKSRSRRTSGRA